MNIQRNLQIIKDYGDQIQFSFGNEFGHYADKVNVQQLALLCQKLNKRTWIVNNRYFLNATMDRAGKLHLIASNDHLDLKFSIQCMDFTVYFNVTDSEWAKIDPKFFYLVQEEWQCLLSHMIPEYRERLNKINILSCNFSKQRAYDEFNTTV